VALGWRHHGIRAVALVHRSERVRRRLIRDLACGIAHIHVSCLRWLDRWLVRRSGAAIFRRVVIRAATLVAGHGREVASQRRHDAADERCKEVCARAAVPSAVRCTV
jgi:hypothetical protein